MSIESMTSDNPGPLFDLEEGERRKNYGKQEALQPGGRVLLLAEVQATARHIARERGEVTVDDLYEVYGTRLDELGNGRGSIFDGFAPVMAWSQKMVKSKRPSRRANHIAVWRLK